MGARVPAVLSCGAVVIVSRLVLHVLVGLKFGVHLVLRLPSITLPSWAAGIQLGGTVYLEGLLGGGRARPPARGDHRLHRRRQRAGQPQAAAAIAALAPCTRSARPSWCRCRSRRSSPRASSGCAGPSAARRHHAGGSARCRRWRSRCSRTPSSARCCSPPRWTRAATAGPAPRRVAPPAHRRRHARPGCSPQPSASTACSTRPTPALMGTPALLSVGVSLSAARPLARRAARRAQHATGPTRGGGPSGSPWPAAWSAAPPACSRSRGTDPLSMNLDPAARRRWLPVPRWWRSCWRRFRP